jgi:hypothetical protein
MPSENEVVEIFPRGATGFQKPTRVISFGPHSYPLWLAVDDKQDLYVDLGNYMVDVYAPTNFAKPIATIPVAKLVLDMVLDCSGALYVSEVDQVGVYLQPLIRQKPDGLVLPRGGFEFDIFGSIAIDETNSRLFFNTSPRIVQSWGDFDFAVRPLPGYSESPATKDQMIISKACIGPDNGQGASYGAAVSGRYFMAGCVGDYPGVFVYDSSNYGYRLPVERIGPGYVQSVANIKIGP